ncbi:hypothetical protein SAMN04488542_11645 [Fontibacillus panacisegetis]|uniref:Uncharacterized protein n=1 Tax=Fontibacillus panacisegetis TaxID=670482 RepID=A0A1G7NNS8_9BACL|nr:DUF6544 family protein [Fontibacillus panacisegetis]SDF74939.1 hypothetical protein SAMN04488542_11645 [Fontibacillus panacisegetis]
MGIFLGVIIVIVGLIVIFFNIPYSKTTREFNISINREKQAIAMNNEKEQQYFTEADIADLPAPVQKYFRYCGFIGTPKMSYMKVAFNNVDFSLGRGKSTIKVDYTQYNIVNKPIRIALIDSSMFGVPFQGIDSYIDGKGSMKGVIAKLITLFDQRGEDMDRASLVTFLSESLLAPDAALQDYVTWEEIDDLHAKATISCYGTSASGIFTFNEKGEMTSFTTEDREAIAMDGKREQVTWTAIISDYEDHNGIKQPTTLQAVWNYDEGDLLYFDGIHTSIEYGF